MNSVYSFFEEINDSSGYALSTRTLHSLRDYYFGYLKGLQAIGMELEDGEPPFSQFASWLARRFGKSEPSLNGRWTRYDGGWWRILEEQVGNGESGFSTFFALLSEFQRRTRVVICYTTKPIAVDRIDTSSTIARIEALGYPPENGYYLNIVYSNGKSKVEGFYSSMEELRSSAKSQFNIEFE